MDGCSTGFGAPNMLDWASTGLLPNNVDSAGFTEVGSGAGLPNIDPAPEMDAVASSGLLEVDPNIDG